MFDFNQHLTNSIVKGILSGYKDYIAVRKRASEEMYISNAYAYVKSNHIEDQVAKHVENFVSFNKQNAGPSWKYLRFEKNNKDDNSKMVFIFRNEKYFDEKKVTHGKDLISNSEGKEKKYYKPYMKMNEDADFEYIANIAESDYQMSGDEILFGSNSQNNTSKQPRFFIITYDIDNESKQLVSIKIWVPNPANNEALLLVDLSAQLSEVVKNEEDYSIEEEELNFIREIEDKEPPFVDVEEEFGFELEEETGREDVTGA